VELLAALRWSPSKKAASSLGLIDLLEVLPFWLAFVSPIRSASAAGISHGTLVLSLARYSQTETYGHPLPRSAI
jgi:hypothetical protein